MIALLAYLTMNAQAGVFVAGGVTAAPSPQAQFLTGVPALRFGGGGDRLHVWTSVRMAQYHLEQPEFTATALEPHLGIRYTFDDPIPGAVIPLMTASTYTRLWSLSGEDIRPDEVEPDKSAGLRPVIGVTAGGGLEAVMTANLGISAEFGVDYFTAGYVFDGWVSQGAALTTYAALYVNIRL